MLDLVIRKVLVVLVRLGLEMWRDKNLIGVGLKENGRRGIGGREDR